MADDRIRLQIVTAGGVKFDKMVSYVLLPLDGGEAGVLADHAPFLAAVEDGTLLCRSAQGEEYVYVGAGVVDVFENQVILLVRAAEEGENIDLDRAAASKKRAEERLGLKDSQTDIKRAQASLRRAVAREKTALLYKK